MPKINLRQALIDRINEVYNKLEINSELEGTSVEYKIECILDKLENKQVED